MARGIRIRNPRDRGAEILADPDGYFRRARENARRLVERDAARKRRRDLAHHPDDGAPPRRPNPSLARDIICAALLALVGIVALLAAACIQASP